MSATGSGNEDVVPASYPYCWHPSSDLTIEEFLKKYKPSMVQNDGTKPWLWVRNSNDAGEEGDGEGAVKEAKELLARASDRVKEINEDENIPVRASKKTGAKSKKQVKDEVAAEYSQKLKEVHAAHNYKSGKWLVFSSPDNVDATWWSLAISVAKGPLSKTAVHLAKVATTPMNESSSQRVVCVYMPDVLDKEKVTEVMKVLLRNHGLSLSGVKSNLYTGIGLDSKHPSHIQSTIWKNGDILKDAEIKELKDAYYEELKADSKEKDEMKGAGTEPEKKTVAKPKPVIDDPFGSDSDDEPKPKKKKAAPAKRKGKAEDEKEDDEPPSKKKK
ncbi:hypothetical protein M422DRAFT_26719 [Sphaerobolus stellatus SS14]|nr:hypothetical protein M422DRAFT_26719 [Sphaerobolus stellatus SS14]